MDSRKVIFTFSGIHFFLFLLMITAGSHFFDLQIIRDSQANLLIRIHLPSNSLNSV